MTRRTAYYWKCDVPSALSPVPFDPQAPTAEHWAQCAAEIAQSVFGDAIGRIESGPSHNRHLTFVLHGLQRKYFLRCDISGEPDDYMLAESHLMTLLRGQGALVPEVFATDASRSRWPLSFQITEHVPHGSLHLYDQRNELNRLAVAEQLGACMAQVHRAVGLGFGYIDTSALRETGVLRGLDAAYTDYFVRRLDDHLAELAQSGLLPLSEIDGIRDVLQRHLPLTQQAEGCVVHRDLAFWNVLGEPNRVCAVIDWEDAVLGDPADDVGVFNCFYDEQTLAALLHGYCREQPLSDHFMPRLWLHTLRNMVWKGALRHRMRYFDTPSGAFIRSRENAASLRTFTVQRIREAVQFLKEERQ